MTITAPDASTVGIRQARRADLIEIHRIECASFEQPWPFRAFDRFLDEPGFLVAEGVQGIAGYVVADTVEEYGRRMGHVKDIAVHPERRGRGVGSRLLERSLATLRTQGVDRVKLEVRRSNDEARRLYDRFGFARQHVIPAYYDDGEDALVLVADLGDRH